MPDPIENAPTENPKAGTPDATPPEATEQAPTPSPDHIPVSGEALPNFDDMEARPIVVDGHDIDHQKKRGRGRPPLTDEQKAERRRKRKARDTETGEELAATASAETIVGSLDMVRKAISAGTVPENSDMRASTLIAWRAYFLETGKEIPVGALVAILSTAYVGDALTTEPAKNGLRSIWNKIRGWKVSRHG